MRKLYDAHYAKVNSMMRTTRPARAPQTPAMLKSYQLSVLTTSLWNTSKAYNSEVDRIELLQKAFAAIPGLCDKTSDLRRDPFDSTDDPFRDVLNWEDYTSRAAEASKCFAYEDPLGKLFGLCSKDVDGTVLRFYSRPLAKAMRIPGGGDDGDDDDTVDDKQIVTCILPCIVAAKICRIPYRRFIMDDKLESGYRVVHLRNAGFRPLLHYFIEPQEKPTHELLKANTPILIYMDCPMGPIGILHGCWSLEPLPADFAEALDGSSGSSLVITGDTSEQRRLFMAASLLVDAQRFYFNPFFTFDLSFNRYFEIWLRVACANLDLPEESVLACYAFCSKQILEAQRVPS